MDFARSPVFFNNWHSLPDFGGVSAEMIIFWNKDAHCHHFIRYVDALVKSRARDSRIVMWDLCNEPFNGESEHEIEKTFVPWLQRLYARCKELEASAPVVTGIPPGVPNLQWVNSTSDVLTPHIYYAIREWIKDKAHFLAELDAMVDYANQMGKAMAVTETGWGSLNDRERVEFLQVELGEFTARGLGFCVHLLHHSLVADAHPEGFGPVSTAGYMACINADGRVRPGHEIINNY